MLMREPRARTSAERSGDHEPASPPGCAPRCARLCTVDGLTTAYTAHADELTGYCRRALADHGLAEEITQEVFLRAWRRCATFTPRDGSRRDEAAQLRVWLFAIARNAVIDAVRRRGRRPVLHPDPDHVVQRADPSDSYALVETVEQVRVGLAGLTRNHRRILTAIFVDELTYEQAAARFAIPVGTAKSRIYYALRALRAQLDTAAGYA